MSALSFNNHYGGKPLTSVMDPVHLDLVAVELDALHREESPLHFRAALVAADGSVGEDGSVTRDHHRERVRGEGSPDGTGASRSTEVRRYPSVGGHISPGDAVLGS